MLQIDRTGNALEIRLGGIQEEDFRRLPASYQHQVEAVELERRLDGIAPDHPVDNGFAPRLREIVWHRNRFIDWANAAQVTDTRRKDYIAHLRYAGEDIREAEPLPPADRVHGKLDRWMQLPEPVQKVLLHCTKGTRAFFAAHLPEELQVRLGVALEESVNNAFLHGNGADIRRVCAVSLERLSDVLRCEVRDEGRGFRPDTVPDPTSGDFLNRAAGRGLLMMRMFMDSVTHTEDGRTVCMEKKLEPRPVIYLPS